MFCRSCGRTIDNNTQICPYCGIPANYNDGRNVVVVEANGEKNKWVAFFLCLFLGVFGAHAFYEGRILKGILYLLTGGLLGIGWLIDTILILFKPNPYHV